MKKNVITILAILALLFGPMSVKTAKSQIMILVEEEEKETERVDVDEQGLELPMVPQLGITIDQYAPLGGEILVLGCLGGAYLLSKRRRKE